MIKNANILMISSSVNMNFVRVEHLPSVYHLVHHLVYRYKIFSEMFDITYFLDLFLLSSLIHFHTESYFLI